MTFSNVHFGFNRNLLAISVPTSLALSLLLDRALIEHSAVSIYLPLFGNALAASTLALVGFGVIGVLHAAWFLLQLLGALFTFVFSLALTLGILFMHTFFFEKSVDSLMMLKRHLEQPVPIDSFEVLTLAGDLLGFAIFAMIAVWLHHKAQKRVKWLVMLGISLVAVAAAYRSIAR